MTIVLDFAAMTAVWIILYAVTDDVFKLISKYMVIFTALIGSYEMIVLYGNNPSQYLFIAILAFLIIEIVLDVAYELIQKPAEAAMKGAKP